ncbi:ZIP family metal transporter, partial [Ureibacillus thermosphaericus]|uniref:ZIP family metal transporter n=1 Tax=Ureibacillus thermosphaericus TaxID=51173 RepID=UPI0030C9FB7D
YLCNANENYHITNYNHRKVIRMWLLGLLSNSIGILIGGSIAWVFKGFQNKINSIYALCAGLILGLICIEIFPEAIELGGWSISIVWLIMGMISFEFLHNILNYNHSIGRKSKEPMYLHTGLLLMFSIFVHNFPMGIILGTSQDNEFTISMLQTLLFHSIPEGIILFTPLMLSGINNLILLLFSLVVSIPVALGVIIGGFIGFEFKIISASLISCERQPQMNIFCSFTANTFC